MAQVDFDKAVWALACHLAVGGPPSVNEVNKARGILWGCLSDEDRRVRMVR